MVTKILGSRSLGRLRVKMGNENFLDIYLEPVEFCQDVLLDCPLNGVGCGVNQFLGVCQ